jgi:hypothetical protein
LSRLVFSIHKVKTLLSIPLELKIMPRSLSNDLGILSIDSAFMSVSFLIAHCNPFQQRLLRILKEHIPLIQLRGMVDYDGDG